jgi:hypothetical protein
MLRVNLIGQRIQQERRAHMAWTVCLSACAILLTSTGAVLVTGSVRLVTAQNEINRCKDDIAANQSKADEVGELKREAVVLQPAADLAKAVQGTAGEWGALVRDVTKAVPDRGGYWLQSVETRFDEKTYLQTCQVKGTAQRQDMVGELTSRLGKAEDTFDSNRMTVPSVTLDVDDRSGTQKVGFTIDAGLKATIGVDYQ